MRGGRAGFLGVDFPGAMGIESDSNDYNGAIAGFEYIPGNRTFYIFGGTLNGGGYWSYHSIFARYSVVNNM
jgi:hypothetical protein